MRVLIGVIALVGCLRSEAVVCEFGTCPPGTACDEIHGLCVDPDQLTTCGELVDGQVCKLEAEAVTLDGECHAGVCLAQLCGDGVPTHSEACDGTVPAVGTCFDFEYDYGPLGCSDLCTEGTGGCKRLGWRFRTYPGTGRNGGMWQDGDAIYIANQRGIGRCDATSCTQDGAMVRWHTGIWASGGQIFVSTQEGYVRHYDGSAWSETAKLAEPGAMQPDLFALDAVWGRSPTDVFVVGRLGKIFHFDGTAWTAMTSPTTSHLRAVWGTATAVFAVGDAYTMLRFDGSSWTQVMRDTQSTPQMVDFKSVWGTTHNEVFAVGVDTGGGGGFAGRYDGTELKGTTLPAGTSPIIGVSGRSGSEVYAATGTGDMLFYDGAGWTRMLKPATEGFNSVYAATDAVYVAGNSDLLLAYENAGWVEAPSAPANVNAMWGHSPGNVYAISGCNIYEYDGTTWNAQPLPTCIPCSPTPPVGVNFWLDMFGTSPTDVYAGGPYAALMHRDAAGWTCVTVPASVNPANKPIWSQGVWASGPNDVFVVGGSGDGTALYVIHYNGTSWEDWSDRIRPVMAYAYAVWGSGPNDVYITGTGADGAGKLVRYNGSAWSEVVTGIEMPYKAIWGSGPSDIYVVGSKDKYGSIVHFDGAQWTPVAIPEGLTLWTTSAYHDVHGTGPDNVFVSGTRALLHFDGTHWYPIRRPEVESLAKVQVIGGEVFLSGNSGVGLRLVGDLER